ncbi:hypothetical protein C8J57DRAFT_1706402, partial [Mycena rebaudengoi]
MTESQYATTDDAGYESETGPRNNPTYINFSTNKPVPRPGPAIDKSFCPSRSRSLNREGRAICRIVQRHGFSAGQIAAIFSVSQGTISRALRNGYTPPDDIEKDYNCVDKDFIGHYPPVLSAPTSAGAPTSAARSGGRPRGSKNAQPASQIAQPASEILTPSSDSDDDEDHELWGRRLRKRPCASESATLVGSPTSNVEPSTSASRVAKKPRLANPTLNARRQNPVSLSATASAAAQTTPESRQASGLHVIMYQPPPAKRLAGPTTKRVPASAAQPVSAPLAPQTVPIAVNTPTMQPHAAPSPAQPTLRTFLSSATIADLSAHHALLVRQGFSMPDLRSMSALPSHDLGKMLKELLCAEERGEARDGMSPLHLVALKYEIAKLATQCVPWRVLPSVQPTLRTFLSSATTADLSAHHALLVRQGFSMPDLRIMSSLPSHDLGKMLKELLGAEEGGEARDGMSPLHLAALKYEIKKLGAQVN